VFEKKRKTLKPLLDLERVMTNGGKELRELQNTLVEIPNNFEQIKKITTKNLELQGDTLDACHISLNEFLKTTENSTKDVLKVETRLSSDELLSLAEFQLFNLKTNPLPLELSFPEETSSLNNEIVQEGDRNMVTPLDSVVRSICDALEFKINSDGRFIAELFVELPPQEEYPDYYNIIKHPISINNIREKHYENIQKVVEDFATMFKNARTYNLKSSMVYQDSIELQIEFLKELGKYFPEELKNLEVLLLKLTNSGETKKERSRKINTPVQVSEPTEETIVEDGRTRLRNSRPKHGTWLKRRREDNFFVYDSGSEIESEEKTPRRKKKDMRKSFEANFRKGKIAGGR